MHRSSLSHSSPTEETSGCMNLGGAESCKASTVVTVAMAIGYLIILPFIVLNAYD